MKIKLVLSSDELEALIIDHVRQSGFDTTNKSLDVEFVFDGEDISAVVDVDDATEGGTLGSFGGTKPKKRKRRTKLEIEADAAAESGATIVETKATSIVIEPPVKEAEAIDMSDDPIVTTDEENSLDDNADDGIAHEEEALDAEPTMAEVKEEVPAKEPDNNTSLFG